MTTFQEWRESVLRSTGEATLEALEAELLRGKSTYPLLVEESPESAAATCPVHNFRARVVLNRVLEEDRAAAMEDSETDVLFESEVDLGEQEWLESFLTATVRGSEARVEVDLNILRNVAEIRRLKTSVNRVLTWVLVTEGTGDKDPEALVGETIRQLTGVLAGCEVLEIRQGEGEAFSSLWARLNVARLMAGEAELRGSPDPIQGAGLFQELQRRLS